MRREYGQFLWARRASIRASRSTILSSVAVAALVIVDGNVKSEKVGEESCSGCGGYERPITGSTGCGSGAEADAEREFSHGVGLAPDGAVASALIAGITAETGHGVEIAPDLDAVVHDSARFAEGVAAPPDDTKLGRYNEALLGGCAVVTTAE